jgi:hypothetical protein
MVHMDHRVQDSMACMEHKVCMVQVCMEQDLQGIDLLLREH